ncbi:MAG TPA: XrtA system polysaccharide deacetylase [Gaiellaceae bacterium]|nr:XrtA system polysaccharide deacetylase [Gaiellaceae bacterium]
MSIDVEDWFHVENLRRAVPRETWPTLQLRVERSMDRMLHVMDDLGVRSTCFVLGSVAERAPQLVRRIAEAGHEIASHGYDHEMIHESDEATFRADVTQSKTLLEDISGQEVRGYRAPSFSITDWALPILRDVGFQYDSSHFPTTIGSSRYGKPAALRHTSPIATNDGLTEVGLSCLHLGAQALPWAGGGYFRLIPYPAFKLGVRRILQSGKPYVFYIHPWELDAGQPRVNGLKRSERFRHYLNIERTEARFAALLRDFRWTTIGNLVARHGETFESRQRTSGDRRGDGLAETVSPRARADMPAGTPV